MKEIIWNNRVYRVEVGGGRLMARSATGDTTDQAPPLTATFEPIAPGEDLLQVDGRTYRVFSTRVDDAVFVFLDGVVYEFRLRAGGVARRSGSQLGSMTAPMPALVRSIPISVGDRVEVGATLVVLEAMKMEIPVRAPRSGTVAAIRCRVGQMVQPGEDLVDFA